jgi:two-component system CheB/CheR fusion protein
MHARRAPSSAVYLDILKEEPEEASALKSEFLIGVTQFFRDPEAFEGLAAYLLPKLRARAGVAAPRVWVPGCSTGEEAYSLAILFAEAGEAAAGVQIFATDIDGAALDVARQGRYPREIERHVSEERRGRFFVRTEEGYQVRETLREMCIFSEHDLLNQPPFSRLDLVSCRNLFIYFESEVQARLIPVFHYALAPSGCLFLGPAEGLTSFSDLFLVIDKRHRIFERREDVAPPLPAFPPKPIARAPATWDGRLALDLPGDRELTRGIAAELLDNHAPPAAVVNAQARILFYSGKTGRFMDTPTGAPTNNLFELVDRAIRPEVHALVHRAVKSGEPVRQAGLAIPRGDLVQRVDILVRPLSVASGGAPLYLVVFNEVAAPKDPAEAAKEGLTLASRDSLVQQLESELRETREHLQSTIEEVRSSNEELLSMNEELQSANEELQTSKEELQSLNEELETVNGQLSRKVEELDRAHSDLQNFFENTRVPTLFLSDDLRIQKFTPAADQLFRLIPSDVGRPLSDITTVLDMSVLLAEISECGRSLRPLEREVSYAEGERHFLMRANPYRAPGNVVSGVVVTFYDVTELKRVQERETALAAIVESSSDAIVGYSLGGHITSWNEGAERLFWYSIREALGKPMELLVPPDLRGQLRALEQQVRSGGEATGFETERVRKDGQPVQVSLTLSPVRDRRGALIGLSTVFRDIGDRKRAELMSSRLAAIVQSSDDAIIGKDLSGTILSWNDAAEHLFGFSAEEMIGTPIYRIVPPELQGEVAGFLETIRHGQRIKHQETVRLHKDGRRVPVSLSISPIKDGTGRIVGASKIARDMSERVQTEAALKHSLTLRDQFISLASHELKTPLTSMKLQVDLAKRALERNPDDGLAPERVARFVEQTQRSVHRLNRLIDEMLDASRIASRGPTLREERFDLADLAREVCDQLEGHIAAAGCTLKLELSPGVVGSWDRTRIEQVVANLLTNSCRYAGGAPIEVRVDASLGWARLEVRDHGVGIAPEDHERIFLRFERASSRQGDGAGFGIGLYIVREIVNAHGGSVHVHSRLGEGATFTVLLPMGGGDV